MRKDGSTDLLTEMPAYAGVYNAWNDQGAQKSLPRPEFIGRKNGRHEPSKVNRGCRASDTVVRTIAFILRA